MRAVRASQNSLAARKDCYVGLRLETTVDKKNRERRCLSKNNRRADVKREGVIYDSMVTEKI